MENVKTTPVHISEIATGDTIVHNGKLTTVNRNHISRCSFMGISLFGDNHKSGTVPVQKVVGWIGKTGEIFPVR